LNAGKAGREEAYMKTIIKYTAAIALTGALALAAVVPGEARDGRNAAAAIGFGAGALVGAAAASAAHNNSYYYGSGYYAEPGYSYYSQPSYVYEPAPVYTDPYAYEPAPGYYGSDATDWPGKDQSIRSQS
jgi:hypothetical protein